MQVSAPAPLRHPPPVLVCSTLKMPCNNRSTLSGGLFLINGVSLGDRFANLDQVGEQLQPSADIGRKIKEVSTTALTTRTIIKNNRIQIHK